MSYVRTSRSAHLQLAARSLGGASRSGTTHLRTVPRIAASARGRMSTTPRCRNAENASNSPGSRLSMLMNPIRWTRRHMERTDYAAAIYRQCAAQFDERQNMAHYFNMAETFNSWYMFVVLHLWMYNCRMRAEGVEGKEIMQLVFEHLWMDVEQKLTQAGAKRINSIVQGLVASYYGQSLAYDEGIFRGDAVLAAALWRNFLDADEDVSPAALEQLVIYVRRQLTRLEKTPVNNVLRGKFTFDGVEFPFNGDPLGPPGNTSYIPATPKVRVVQQQQQQQQHSAAST